MSCLPERTSQPRCDQGLIETDGKATRRRGADRRPRGGSSPAFSVAWTFMSEIGPDGVSLATDVWHTEFPDLIVLHGYATDMNVHPTVCLRRISSPAGST